MAITCASNYSGGVTGFTSTFRISPLDDVDGDTFVLTVSSYKTDGVRYVSDTDGNRWMQIAKSTNGDYVTEIWYSKGIKNRGSLFNRGVYVTMAGISLASRTSANVARFTGVWYVDPLDQYGTNYGTSASPTASGLSPRTSGEVLVGVVSTSASVTAQPSGYTSLFSGNQAACYQVLSGSVAAIPSWTSASVGDYSTCLASFVPGQSGVNPRLQFPETLVEVCTQSNYLAPLQGIGVWTNISSYVRSMDIGPLGRQHELDRIEASTAQVNVDNRDGTFNTWNTSSFLWNGGAGLKAQNPVKITAAWSGITYPIFYGYTQAITPSISDVLNVDATITCVDIFQMLSLKYLSNDNYAQHVLTDNPTAYYRLGDNVGTTSVSDYSGNGQTAALVAGRPGLPAYGNTNFFISDSNTSLDLTNGSNVSGGGICSINNTGTAPVSVQPLGSASVWSAEMWVQWTGGTDYTALSVPFTVSATVGNGTLTVSTADYARIPVGSLVTGSGIPDNTYVWEGYTFTGTLVFLTNPTEASSGAVPVNIYPASFALFSVSTVGGQFEMRVGTQVDDPDPGNTYTAIPVRSNRLMVGNMLGARYSVLPGMRVQGFTRNHNLQDGLQHQVAVTYTSGSVSVYIDGVEDARSPYYVGTNYSLPRNISFGCDLVNNIPAPIFGVPTNGFAGWMQDVSLYDTALTATQVANHYAATRWFQSVEIGADNGDYTAGRLNKVLATVGLDPATVLNVPYPFKTQLYAESADLTTTSALNYIQTITETEPGVIYQGQDGMIYAYNRQYQYLNPKSVATTAIYGDSASVAYHYLGDGLQITADDLDLWNDVQVQSSRPANAITGQTASVLQEWGPVQSAAASVSNAYYGARTMQGLTSLQQEYDLDAMSLAQNYLAWYQTPLQRITQISTSSASDNGSNIPNMLGLDLIDLVEVQYQGQTPGPQFKQQSVVEQIAHSIVLDSGPEWTTTWALSPYEVLLDAIVFGTSSATFTAASVTAGQLTL